MESNHDGALGTQSGAFWANLSVDRSNAQPLQRQLHAQIRSGIVSGTLPRGERLPASRSLASEVGCSRNTVLEVVAQLIAEGYLISVRGSGVFVADDVPDDAFTTAPPSNVKERAAQPEPETSLAARTALSQRGETISSARLWHRGSRHAAFSPSMPDVSLFPLATWTQLHAQEWRDRGEALLTESDPRGFEPLRHAIAEYVSASRGVVCSDDQIMVTAGAQQGIDLAARLLVDPGDCAWVEDPGYPAIRELFRAAGAFVVAKPVDDSGLKIDTNGTPPRAIAVSPSHQYPTGVTMTLERRLELLAYAEQAGAWIIEDDYDSEFRYEGRPLAALAGLGDRANGRTIYVGTFSKMLFPAIRLGYLVVPKHLVREFARARMVLDLQPSIVAQPTLARFITEGHLATHVRRMRPIYRQRQQVLIAALEAHASDLLTTAPDIAGMHLVARFTPQLARRYDDAAAARVVGAKGVNVQPLSLFYSRPEHVAGFVLGFACADEPTLERAVEVMAAALRA